MKKINEKSATFTASRTGLEPGISGNTKMDLINLLNPVFGYAKN